MKKITLLCLSVLLASALQARVVEVSSVGDYPNAYASAVTGDTLLLTVSGTYVHQNLPTGKVITVMAPDTVEAVINGEAKFEQCDGGGICYENVTLSNPRRLFWDAGKTGQGTIEIISFKNCVLTDIAYSLICSQSAIDECHIRKLVFDNCLIHDISTAGWNFLYVFIPIDELVFNECTFYNEGKSTSLLDSRIAAKDVFTPSIKLTMTHNTFYLGAGNFFSFNNNYPGEENSMVIEDNIFVCPDGKSFDTFLKITAGWWNISVKNNLFAGCPLPALAEDFGEITLSDNFTPEDLEMTKGDVFADAAGSNFTIYSFSPLASKSTTNGVIGASRWLKDVEVVNLSHGLATGVDSTAGTIQGPKGKVEKGGTFTLTAVKNFGYKFVKWIDANGDKVSEDATLTFVADKDLVYYAVFEAVNVYHLDVTVKGGGAVEIDLPGKDGGYEYYEDGTVLHLIAKENKVTTFVFWEGDNSLFLAQPEIELTVTSDYHITAEFYVKPYVCAFIFDTKVQQTSSAWAADLLSECYSDKENVPAWKCYSTETGDESSYLIGSFWSTYQSYVWKRPTVGQGYYFQTLLNTKGYTSDVVVDFDICGIYFSWNKVLLQMSYDSERWETVDTIAVTGGFVNHVDTLPYSSGQETLYVRFYPDLNGTYSGDPASQNESEAYRNIYFIADAPTAIHSAKAESDEEAVIRYYNLMGQRVAPDTKGLIIKVQGNKVSKILNR